MNPTDSPPGTEETPDVSPPPAETTPPPAETPRPSWRRRADLVLVVGLTALVLISYVWPQSFGDESMLAIRIGWVLSLVQMLQFHIGVFMLCGVAFAAWRRSWRGAIATLPLLAMCLGPAAWAQRPRDVPALAGERLKVMAANLLMVSPLAEPDRGILVEVAAADPDVLLLTEYSPRWHTACKKAGLLGRYPHKRMVVRDDSFGMAVYSKRPLLGEPTIMLPLDTGTLPEMRVEVEVDGRRVAVYAIHLLPPRKLLYTVAHRQQFADLLNVLEAEQLPVILAGDFNFTERSPHADRLEDLGFTDTLDSAGFGRETTWPVLPSMSFFPSLRLDHVYLRDLVATSSRTGEGEGSDHRPVFATVGFAR